MNAVFWIVVAIVAVLVVAVLAGWSYAHSRRSRRQEADSIVRGALDEQGGPEAGLARR